MKKITLFIRLLHHSGSATFQAHINVAPEFHGLLVGRKGDTKRQLELETGASIVIPRQGSNSEDVTISGPLAPYESFD